MTINEALIYKKTLDQRHAELITFRGDNKDKERRYYGPNDKEVIKEPTYDVKVLDRRIVTLTKEQRRLELAIKQTNATTQVIGWEPDDSVLDAIE